MRYEQEPDPRQRGLEARVVDGGPPENVDEASPLRAHAVTTSIAVARVEGTEAHDRQKVSQPGGATSPPAAGRVITEVDEPERATWERLSLLKSPSHGLQSSLGWWPIHGRSGGHLCRHSVRPIVGDDCSLRRGDDSRHERRQPDGPYRRRPAGA